MHAIFLADAHLRHPRDKNYQLLLDFLKQQKDLDALFLLGDIFEFWLGYRHLVFSAYVPILEALRRLSETGTQLYYVEGNHDFNLGPYFSNTLNCRVITEQQLLSWDGLNILLCHGDLLNPSPAYRRLRRFWRSRPSKLLARLVHPDLVWKFAFWLSNKSAKNNGPSPHQDPTPYLISFSDRAENQKADLILCGHYHYPTQADHRGSKLIALGDWIEQFSYAELKDGEIELKNYTG